MSEQPQKILVIDDLPANIAAMKVVLAPLSVELVCATSGNEGLATTLDHEFALVLLDINMPGMDGFEVAEILRQDPRTSRIPIIFVTAAFNDDITRMRGYDAGAVDYIEKPINTPILLSKIKVFLELDAARKQMTELLATLETRVEEKTKSLREEMAERRRAERSATESEAKLRAILNSALDAIVVSDNDRNVLFWNPAAANMLGYTESEIIGKPFATILSDSNTPSSKAGIFLSDGSGHFSASSPFTLNVKRKSGQEIPIEMALSRREEDGQWTYVSVFRDIRSRLRRQTALENAVDEAIYANHAKTIFLANMSHELRTPLNSIIGFSEMMSEKMLGELSDNYSEYARIINSSGTYLLRIIQDVLDMSKVEAGKMDLFEIIVDLVDLSDEIQNLVEPDAREENTRISFAIQPKHQYLFCDPVRIKQCLINLISNAIRFTPGGKVDIKTSEDSEWLKIEIIDDGVGMSNADLKIALKQYGQAENAALTRRNGDGAGLGLTLTQQLLELHKGKLEIISQKGKGTRAIIMLPIDRVSLAPVIPHQMTEKKIQSQATISDNSDPIDIV